MSQWLSEKLFGKSHPDQAQEELRGNATGNIEQVVNCNTTSTSQNTPSHAMSANFMNNANITGNVNVGDISTGNTNTTTTTYHNYDSATASSNTARSSDSLENEAEELRRKLTVSYSKLVPPNQSARDQGKKSFDSYDFQLEANDSKESIETGKIFDGGKKILVESPPGGGKSTLAFKVAYDWAVRRNYTKKFKFVFLITCSLRNQNLKKSVLDELVDIAKNVGYERPQNVKKIIDRFCNETVLIFDGFGELGAKGKENVLKVLFKKEFANAVVLVTCKTGLYLLTDDDKKLLGIDGAKNPAFYDKKLTILV